MENNLFANEYIRILEAETTATRKCLERIDEKFFNYKPHEKSMLMGYLATLVAEIPKWIAVTIENGEIDFATWEKYKLSTTAELVKYFDQNIEAAKNALKNTSDKALLEEKFVLKMGGKVLMEFTKRDSIAQSINHWAHHRGQLTVYMRLNDIAVPSIYGPTADDKSF